jgi:hypothetical protein
MSDSETDPSTLYHYTDAAGLYGIVKPSFSSWEVDNPALEESLTKAAQLRASDVRYMNNSQELKFGGKFFVTRLSEPATDSTLSENAQKACRKLAAIFSTEDVFNWDLRCFAACLCSDGDLLSQWRGYAAGVGGYAIGFTRDVLENHSISLPPHYMTVATQPQLKPVKYGTADAEDAANRFIDEMRNPPEFMAAMIDGHPDHQEETQAIGLEWLASYALRAIVGLKDDGFQEEREWRLISLAGDPRKPVRTHLGRPGILPYEHIAVNFKKVDEKTLPPTIERLVVGPGHNQRSQIAAARELLKARGHNPDVVVPSKLSFTG